MSDHLIAEANRHAMALPTTHPTHADIAWYVREVGELRAEMERLKRDYDYDHKCLHEVRERCELWKQRAERAEAELATERARLDWLESKCPILWSLADHATGPYWLLTDFPGYTEETASQHKTARAAIDAAMKEGA